MTDLLSKFDVANNPLKSVILADAVLSQRSLNTLMTGWNGDEPDFPPFDDQDGIGDPTGMTGTRLEVNVHAITCSTTAVQNTVTCVNRAGLEVVDTVLTQISAAEACLTQDEKELGVALLDIGGGTTDLAIFDRGAAWHTAVLPVGGSHFSNDLAVGLRTPIPDAERLKRKYGRALTSMVETDETVEVPSVGGRQPRQLSVRMMAEILEPRASEIFSLIHQEVVRAGFDRSLNAGVVLTGGGSILPGMAEVAEQIFDLPVRIGPPDGIHGLADPGSAPQFATAIGLAMYSARHRPPRARMSFSVPAGGFGRVGGRVKAWFSEIF